MSQRLPQSKLRRERCLRFESLEPRALLTLVWDPTSSNAWDDPQNWDDGSTPVEDRWRVPAEFDDVEFPYRSGTGAYQVALPDQVVVDEIVIHHSLVMQGNELDAQRIVITSDSQGSRPNVSLSFDSIQLTANLGTYDSSLSMTFGSLQLGASLSFDQSDVVLNGATIMANSLWVHDTDLSIRGAVSTFSSPAALTIYDSAVDWDDGALFADGISLGGTTPIPQATFTDVDVHLNADLDVLDYNLEMMGGSLSAGGLRANGLGASSPVTMHFAGSELQVAETDINDYDIRLTNTQWNTTTLQVHPNLELGNTLTIDSTSVLRVAQNAYFSGSHTAEVLRVVNAGQVHVGDDGFATIPAGHVKVHAGGTLRTDYQVRLETVQLTNVGTYYAAGRLLGDLLNPGRLIVNDISQIFPSRTRSQFDLQGNLVLIGDGVLQVTPDSIITSPSDPANYLLSIAGQLDPGTSKLRIQNWGDLQGFEEGNRFGIVRFDDAKSLVESMPSRFKNMDGLVPTDAWGIYESRDDVFFALNMTDGDSGDIPPHLELLVVPTPFSLDAAGERVPLTTPSTAEGLMLAFAGLFGSPDEKLYRELTAEGRLRHGTWDVVMLDASKFGSNEFGLLPGVAFCSVSDPFCTSTRANATVTFHEIGHSLAHWMKEVGLDQYQRYHLLASSGGSWLVDGAADGLRALESQAYIHLTLFDAYAPADVYVPLETTPAEMELGDTATWTDHYYNTRSILAGDTLTHAWNADVTKFEPISLDQAVLSSLVPRRRSHAQPYNWYIQTIQSPEEFIGGFNMSYAWSGESRTLPRGEDTLEPPNHALPWWYLPQYFSTPTETAPYGSYAFLENETLVINASNETEVHYALQVEQPTDLLQFDLEFVTRDLGLDLTTAADGVFSVEFQGLTLFEVQRSVLEDYGLTHLSSGPIQLYETLLPGQTYDLVLRLLAPPVVLSEGGPVGPLNFTAIQLSNLSLGLDRQVPVEDATPPQVAMMNQQSRSLTPTLSGVVDDPHATVVVELAGRLYQADTPGDGTWVIPGSSLFAPLARGVHALTLWASDEIGNFERTHLPAALEVLGGAWQNPTNPLNVNDDDAISPLDAVLIINALNARGSVSLIGEPNPLVDDFFDVNGDDQLTPLDALLIINYINAGGTGTAEGEPTAIGQEAPDGVMYYWWQVEEREKLKLPRPLPNPRAGFYARST